MNVTLYTPPTDSTMASALVIMFALSALVAMQQCTAPFLYEEKATLSYPERSPKKVTVEMASKLKPMILEFLRANPGSSATVMFKTFSCQMPEVTLTNINSCIYTMFNKKVLRMKVVKERIWFVAA